MQIRPPKIIAITSNQDKSTIACAKLAIRLGEVLVVDLCAKGILFHAIGKQMKNDPIVPDVKSILAGKCLYNQVLHARNFSVIPAMKSVNDFPLDPILHKNLLTDLKKTGFDYVLFDCGVPETPFQQSSVFQDILTGTFDIDQVYFPNKELTEFFWDDINRQFEERFNN